MPDLLTHVLAGYCLGVCLSFRYDWISPEYVTLVMIGALSPDFVKISLIVPETTVQALLGVPFSWSPLHTLGGSVLVVLLGALLVAPEYRTQAIALFAIGAASHHVLDMMLLTVTGYSYALLWPVTAYQFPSPNLYLSSDRWPAIIAGLCAALVRIIDRQTELARRPP